MLITKSIINLKDVETLLSIKDNWTEASIPCITYVTDINPYDTPELAIRDIPERNKVFDFLMKG